KMMDYSFLRQRSVLNYIADFMCEELQLIIEVDGYTHENERKWYKDLDRQKELEEKGFTVLRFTDEEVMNDLKNVERTINRWIEDRPPTPSSDRRTGSSKGDSKPSLKNRFKTFIQDLQDEIWDRLEKFETKAQFRHDDWQRKGGGGG